MRAASLVPFVLGEATTKVNVHCSPFVVCCKYHQEAPGLTSEIGHKKEPDDWTTLNSFPHPGRSSQVTKLNNVNFDKRIFLFNLLC